MQAKMLERQNMIEEGGLCRRSDVERFITEFLTETRTTFLRMAVDFAAGYGSELQHDLLEDLESRVKTNLNKLGDFIEKMEDLEIRE